MADGPFCFQENPNKEAIAIRTKPLDEKKKDRLDWMAEKVGAVKKEVSQSPAPIVYFITEEKYNEIRNVHGLMSTATEFINYADKVEETLKLNKQAQEKKHVMSSTYIIMFDEYWV